MRELPGVEEIRPGLWSVPVPIPNNPLGFVLTYVFEVPGGVVLVDPGWNAPEAIAALEEGLAGIGASIKDTRGVLVTHIHPDHYGLAGWVREASGAWIGLHPADAALIPSRYEDVDELLERTAVWLAEAGAPASELESLQNASLFLRAAVHAARPDVLLEDGDRPEVPGWELVALHTPGHTPGHLCFHEGRSGLTLTGDHVLPRISPNIPVHPQSGADPLGDYLASLERLRAYGDGMALPGHEGPVASLAKRVDELRAHHEQRLDETLARVAAGARTVWEVAQGLRWSRPWPEIHGFMRRAALGETQAHLVLLERQGQVVRADGTPIRWRPA